MSRRLTLSEFIEKALLVHGGAYQYGNVEYIGNKTKVIITCKTHGEFQQIPSDHLLGKGCKKCGIECSILKQTGNVDAFIGKAYGVHGGIYEYTDAVYLNNRTKVKIICKAHGEFQQTPNNHLEGQGCPKCGIHRRALQKVSNATAFIDQSTRIHGDTYDYSSVVYTNARHKVSITCKIHGEFQQAPYNHLSGRGCRFCSVGGFDPSKPGTLYYICIDGSVYKIGITNLSIKRRFLVSEVSRIVVIEELLYDHGEDCYNKEQWLLRKYKEHLYTGPPVLRSGHTEMFNIDLLGYYGVASIIDL